MPFTYRQVKDLYDTLADAGAVTKPLAEWAGDMSTMTGSDLYDAGLHDNVIKRASVGIDRALEATGLPKLGGEFGRTVSEPFGMGDQGQSIGEGLPRMAVNFLPAIAAEAVTGGGATPFILGALGTGALSGAETYTATGSPAAGVVSGAVNALLPGVTGKVEQGILGRLGAREVAGSIGRTWESKLGEGFVTNPAMSNGIPRTLDAVKQYFPTNFGQRAAAFGGGQLAAAGIMGGSELAQQALAGQPISNPFTPEFGLGLGLSQLPFSLLHLGGKLVGGAGKSPMERANDLQNLIDLTTRGTNLKAARDASKEATPVMKIPEVKPILTDPVAAAKIKADTDAILANLGQQRKDIESNPTPDNIDKLNEIKIQEDQVGDKQVEQTGGVGVGLSQPTTGTIPVTGEAHFYGNKQNKPETGFHIVTVKENPNDALKYPDGTPVQPGDRIQWPAGRKDPEVNKDSSENFLVPKGRFSKIVDKAMEQKVIDEIKNPELPDQSGGDLVSHQARLAKAQEEFKARQEQHKINLDDLENIRQDLALRGTLSYGELVDSLQEVNRIREQAGYPEIDLATLAKTIKETRATSRKAGLLSAIEETKRFELIQEAAHADALLKDQKGVDVYGKISEMGEKGDPEAQKILDLYEELSASPGNRGLLASSGLFWNHAQELEAKGQLTLAKMASFSQAVVKSPKGPKGMLEKQITVELPPTIFKALTAEEKAMRQIGAEAILKVTAGDAESDEAKVLRQLVYDGSFGKGLSKEAVAEAFYHARIEGIETDQDAEIAAGEWMESPKVHGWVRELANNLVKNELPEPQFKVVDESPFALRDSERVFNGPLLEAYDRLVAKDRMKFPTVSIGELAQESGIPLNELHDQLRALHQQGKVVMGVGDFSLSNKVTQEGGMMIPGYDKPVLTVRPLDPEISRNLQEEEKFSPRLEEEINHLILASEESHDPTDPESSIRTRNEAIQELMQDMDEKDHPAHEFRKELQDYGIKLGIWKPYTKEQLSNIQTLGRGKKYDFKRGDTYYIFDSWRGLDQKEGQANILKNQLPPSYDPSDPKEQAIVDQLSGNGIEQLQSVSKDPFLTQIAQAWIKQFSNLLKLQQGYVHDGVGTYARGHIEGLGNGIFYDKSNISAKPEARETAVIHEMGHGLTQQLIDELGPDHPLIKELDGIRMRARQALSADLKAYLDAATNSDWLGRYRRGQADASELGPDAASRQILYGLLDNKEMTAQLWSSHDFREHFRGIDGRTGVWRKFLEWTKKILGLGNVDNTLLGELLGATGQLMHKGEWLADMEGFGERWFESQGKGGAYGQAQTQRAMGILAEINDGMSPEEMSGSLQMGEGKFNPELVKRKAKLEQTFQNLDEETQQLHDVLDEHGQDASVDGVDNMVLEAMSDGKGLEDTLDLLPDSAVKYIFAKLDDHKDVLDVLAAATKEKNKGLINIINPKLVRDSVKPTLKQVEKILKNRDRHLDLAQKLVNLQAVEPQGFVNAAASYALKDTENFIEGEGKGTGGIMSWLSRFLEPMAQKARRIPEMAEGISKGFELGPNARKMFSEAMKVFGMDTSSPNLDVLSHDSVQQSQKVFQTPKELNAVDKWIHLNQVEGKDAVVMLPESHPEVQKILSKLTAEEKERVRDMVAKQGKSTQMLNAQKLEKMKQIAAVSAAGHILKESGLKVRDAIGLADATIKAIVDMNDPVMQLTAQAQLQAVQARLQPEVFLELLKFSQGEAQKINDWKTYFDKNPFWATAQRTERYHVQGRNKAGKQIKNQASSLTEAREVAERLGIGKPEIIDSWKGREDEPFSFPNMPPEMAQRMEQIEENQIQMLKASGVIDSPEAEADYRRTSAVTQILREATANQAIPGVSAPGRLLSQGAEELPWMWNHISNAQRESNYWSRQLLRAQSRTYLRDPELSSNENLRKDLATHYENLLHPDPEIAQKMTKFASTWFLGFNLASSLINAAQPFATHVGELTAISGKPIDSYKRVLRALSELGGRFLGKKDYASKEHHDFMEGAVKDGEVGIGMYDDMQNLEEQTATNLKRMMMKNKPQSIGQRLGSAAGTYSDVAMWVFQHGERLNARAALIASFDLYRDMGLGFEEAKQKAYEFNRSVNYSGGRAQRPVGAFSGRGAFPRTAAMLGTSLQSYVLGTTFQIARYLQKGLFRPTGATPHEVYAARKAAIQMLGTQFAAAGLLGLPFVSGAIGLLDKLFPDLELNKHVRGGMQSFLSSDHENGSVLTDIAMTGVPSMLGWDLQSRLSMGNSLPGVSEINGFQPENLMGPAANIVRNFVGGVQGWVKGDPSATANFLPPAVKKAVQLGTSVLTDGGEIRDYQGRPLSQPTPGEHLGQLLGFQPKRLSDQNAAARIATQADQVASRHESQDRMEMAQEILKGNFGTVRNRLLSQARDDKNYNPQDAVKAIARSAEELTFPRDLRREGSARTGNDRAGLLSSFSNLSGGVSQASEVQRLQYRMGIEQKLGLPPTNFRSELAMAQMMDQLRQASPSATRSQLRAIAQQQLRRSVGRQPMLQDIQE